MEQIGTETTPRIYVASLSDYNAGRLHGEWIDADQDAEAIHAAIAAMLSKSKESLAEEWAIHDYEGFGGLSLGEFESIETVSEVASLLSEHGGMFGALVEHFGGLANLVDAKACMDGGYQGIFHGLGEYAASFFDDCYGDVLRTLPDLIVRHIDFEAIGRDMEISSNIIFTIEYGGDVHVFSTDY